MEYVSSEFTINGFISDLPILFFMLTLHITSLFGKLGRAFSPVGCSVRSREQSISVDYSSRLGFYLLAEVVIVNLGGL